MDSGTLDLLVRQRRDRDAGELLHESLVQPVKVLVPPGHLDVVELKDGMGTKKKEIKEDLVRQKKTRRDF